jgi:hypothetical protein
MSGPVLTTAQAAEYVGLKPQTMRKLKCIGTGPKAYKQGRLTVYYPGDLDEWLSVRLTLATPSTQGDEPGTPSTGDSPDAIGEHPLRAAATIAV